MAATATALGTTLLTGYGIANELGKNPANPLTKAVTTAKENIEMDALKAQLRAARTQLAEFEVNKLKERAELVKQQIQAYASEQESTMGPQAGGGQTGGVTRAQAKAALGELTEREVAGLQNAIVEYMGKVDTSSKINQIEHDLYTEQLTTLAGYAQNAMTRNFRDAASAYIEALDARLRSSPGSDDKEVTIAWNNVQRWQNIDQLKRGDPALPSPAGSASTVATEPSPPSPPPVAPRVPPRAPPQPFVPAPAPQPPVPAPAPQPPVPAPAPPAPTSTETDTSITGTLTALGSSVIQAVGTPTLLIPGLEKLRTRIDTQVLEGLTVETLSEKKKILTQIETAFRELREARKRNEPLDDRALKEKVDQLLARVEAFWTETLSTALATATPALIEQYFELRAKVRTLKSEIGEEETSELTNRYNELATEFVAMQTAQAPVPVPAPPPGPPPPPTPPPPVPVPGPPGAGTGLPPAPTSSETTAELSTPTGSDLSTPTGSDLSTPTSSETPAPAPREIPNWRTADALERDNYTTLLSDLRGATDLEDLESRVADYRQLLNDPRFDGEEGAAASARLDQVAQVVRQLFERGAAPAPAPAPAPVPEPVVLTPEEQTGFAELERQAEEELNQPSRMTPQMLKAKARVARAKTAKEDVEAAIAGKKPLSLSALRRNLGLRPSSGRVAAVPGGTVGLGDADEARSVVSRSQTPTSSAERGQALTTEGGETISLENPLRNPAREPGGPLPGGTGAGSYGSSTATNIFRAQVTPQGRTVGTVRANPKGGRRRTLRKKRLTSRRGNKTNGK